MAFEGTLQEFTIRMHGHTLEHPYIEAQQGDTASRKVRIHLKTFDGADFLIPYGATAVLSVNKSDGHKILNECEIEDSSTVIITLTSQTIACPGIQLSQIYLFTDDWDIKTQKFYIHVPKAVYDQDAIESSDEYGILLELIERIENLGGGGSGATEEQLEQIEQNKNDITQLKSDLDKVSGAIVQTASGESIVTNDSSNDPLRGLRVFGKTEQVTTTGKNKLPNADVGQTINGVTFTVNEDKSVTINGTATNVADFYLFGGATDDGYYFNTTQGSLLSFGVTSDNVIPIFREKELGVLIGHSNISNGLMAQHCSFYGALLRVEGGQTVNNKTVYPMIREAGITDETYEPYTGGIPSPNPQYPQELVSVGDDGDIEVGMHRKNLFNPDRKGYLSNGDGSITSSTYTYSMSSYLPVESLMTAIVKDYDASASDSYAYRVGWYDSNKNWINNVVLDNSKTTLKAPTNAKYFRASAGYADTLMVCYGDANEYEPYHKQSLTALTPNGLPGIQVTDASFATYTDSNGQMWCADEKDYERGVRVQRIYNESLLEKIDKCQMVDNTAYSESILRFDFADAFGCKAVTPILSDRFRYTFAHSDTNVGEFRSKECISSHSVLDKVSVFIDKSRLGSADLSGFTAWLQTNDTNIQVILATPIETPLSEEELTAYRALHSNYPVTTILNDSGAHMEVKYNADTKNYIDNKFAEMTNAILSMGGNV